MMEPGQKLKKTVWPVVQFVGSLGLCSKAGNKLRTGCLSEQACDKEGRV